MCSDGYGLARSGEPSFGPQRRLSNRPTGFHQHFTNSRRLAVHHQSHRSRIFLKDLTSMTSTPTTATQEQAFTVTGKPLQFSSNLPSISLHYFISDTRPAFAKDLQDQISSTTASSNSSPLAIPDDTLRTLDTHLHRLPLSRAALTVSMRQQLDRKGTELWNTCLQVMMTCRESRVRGLLSKGLSGPQVSSSFS